MTKTLAERNAAAAAALNESQIEVMIVRAAHSLVALADPIKVAAALAAFEKYLGDDARGQVESEMSWFRDCGFAYREAVGTVDLAKWTKDLKPIA